MREVQARSRQVKERDQLVADVTAVLQAPSGQRSQLESGVQVRRRFPCRDTLPGTDADLHEFGLTAMHARGEAVRQTRGLSQVAFDRCEDADHLLRGIANGRVQCHCSCLRILR